MVSAAGLAYKFANEDALKENEFSFGPVKEVGFLFAGIFATMVPALDLLEHHAGDLGISTVRQFHWGSGALSSVLDNAPTYLNFLSAEVGLLVHPGLVTGVQQAVATHGASLASLAGDSAAPIRATYEFLLGSHGDLVAAGRVPDDDIMVGSLLANHPLHITAISLGAVFFGACSYIGNGPNFMVKSIAEQTGVKCPSFFGYIAVYTLPVLIPVFVITWWLFLR
jgi:Na+/H+ antiporter NhaD/arsenite permease-like protein